MVIIITSGRSNLRKGRVTAAHGLFSRICQMEPMFTPSMLPWAHLSSRPKWHLDWISPFCAAHSRESLYYTLAALSPLKIAASHWESGPPSDMVPWAHSSPESKRHLNRFGHFCRAYECDRPTDWPHYQSNNRLHLRSTAMRPNNM